MTTASNFLTFWHVVTVLPPQIEYIMRPFDRNDSYLGRFTGNGTLLTVEGDKLLLRCRSEFDHVWLKSDLWAKNDWKTIRSDRLEINLDKAADGSIFACAIEGFGYGKNNTAEEFSSKIFIRVRKCDKETAHPEEQIPGTKAIPTFEILRHTSTKISLPVGDAPELCVDLHVHTTDGRTSKYRTQSFLERLEKAAWQLPAKNESQCTYKKIIHSLKSDVDRKIIELTTCIRIMKASAACEGQYRFDLSSVKKMYSDLLLQDGGDYSRQHEAGVTFSVGLISNISSSINLTVGSENTETVQLLASNLYKMSCQLHDKNTKIFYDSVPELDTPSRPDLPFMSWCKSGSPSTAVTAIAVNEDYPTKMRSLLVTVSPVLENIATTAYKNISPLSNSISAPMAGDIKCTSDKMIFRHEVSTVLKYTIVDSHMFSNANTDLLVETQIGSGHAIVLPSNPVRVRQGTRISLRCIVPRCNFGVLKWIRSESDEIIDFVESYSNTPDMEKEITKKMLNGRTIEDTQEFVSRFYSTSLLTIVFEITFPSVRHSRAGSYVCLASPNGTDWKRSAEVHLQVRVPEKNRKSFQSTRAADMSSPNDAINSANPATGARATNQDIPLRQFPQAICTEKTDRVVVAVTVSALASLLVLGACSLALCHRLNKANLLKHSSMVIRSPIARRQQTSVKTRLLANNTPSLATEEEMSI